MNHVYMFESPTDTEVLAITSSISWVSSDARNPSVDAL
jgi:hypothetical protein